MERSAAFMHNVGMTDKSIMFTGGGNYPVMQCIGFDVFDSTQKIFDKFDYTINMGAFNFETEEWGDGQKTAEAHCSEGSCS